MKVSVIIPTFNSAKILLHCLESLSKQTVNRDIYEVIVVDDGSTDNTKEVVAKYHVNYIFQQNRGPAAARNLGVKNAKGEIVLFTDADCVPEPNWIEEMIKPMVNPEIIGVKGAYKTRQKELIARLVQIEYEHKYERMKKFKYIDFIDTYSAAYRRDVFLRYRGFDERYPTASVEDQEFSFRLFRDGHKMVFNPEAIVYHRHVDNLLGYLKKKYKIAFWKAFLLKRHPEKVKSDTHTPQGLKIQIILAYCAIIGFLLSPFYKSMFQLTALCLTLFMLSCIPFFLFAMKKDLTVSLISPFVFFLRSLSLGLGLFIGMIKHSLKK